MKPYNNNILIIDDKVAELEDEIITPLQRQDFVVEKQSNPSSGLTLASHKYSIVFIDFQFDNSVEHNGTSLCYSIREKCPLSTLILLTAYGKDHIDEFNHAPWDHYYEKGKKGVRARDLDNRIAKCLEEAVSRRHDKTPFLKNVPSETRMIADRTEILDKIQTLFKTNEAAKRWGDEAIAKELKFSNRAALSQKFTLRNSETFELKKDALIFRHIIMSSPTKWDLAKQHYDPLKNLVSFFCI